MFLQEHMLFYIKALYSRYRGQSNQNIAALLPMYIHSYNIFL